MIDDIKENLPQKKPHQVLYIDQYPNQDDIQMSDIIRPLEPWESNAHCIRSILRDGKLETEGSKSPEDKKKDQSPKNESNYH